MLKEFIEKLAPESVALNEKGAYSLAVEPNLEISLRENVESGITLFTTIAPLPLKRSEEFLLRLMKANLLGKETGGGFFGLDKEGKMITFSCLCPAGI